MCVEYRNIRYSYLYMYIIYTFYNINMRTPLVLYFELIYSFVFKLTPIFFYHERNSCLGPYSALSYNGNLRNKIPIMYTYANVIIRRTWKTAKWNIVITYILTRTSARCKRESPCTGIDRYYLYFCIRSILRQIYGTYNNNSRLLRYFK